MKNRINAESARRLLQSQGWLTQRPQQFQIDILQYAQLLAYDTGSYTHHIGDEPGGVFAVVQGSFGVLGPNLASGVVMGHVHRAGAWFGEGPLIFGTRRLLEFRALEPSTVMHVPLVALERLQHRDPDFRNQIMTLVAHSSLLVSRAVSDLLIRRSEQRIAAVLLRVSGADGLTGPSVTGPVHLTQSIIAELSNCSRHTANVTLKAFEQRGWLEIGYATLTIHSPDGLRSFLTEEN